MKEKKDSREFFVAAAFPTERGWDHYELLKVGPCPLDAADAFREGAATPEEFIRTVSEFSLTMADGSEKAFVASSPAGSYVFLDREEAAEDGKSLVLINRTGDPISALDRDGFRVMIGDGEAAAFDDGFFSEGAAGGFLCDCEGMPLGPGGGSARIPSIRKAARRLGLTEDETAELIALDVEPEADAGHPADVGRKAAEAFGLDVPEEIAPFVDWDAYGRKAIEESPELLLLSSGRAVVPATLLF